MTPQQKAEILLTKFIYGRPRMTLPEKFIETEKIYISNIILTFPISLFKKSRNRYVEVDVNIPQARISDGALDLILTSLEKFMNASGFEYEAQEKPVYGSFFQRLIFKTKKPVTKEELKDVLDESALALQNHHSAKPTTESSASLTNAAANLILACAGVDEIVVRTGTIILVKAIIDNAKKMLVETISYQLMSFLDENPGILKEPKVAYHFLSKLPEQFRQSRENDSEKRSTKDMGFIPNKLN